ncbi:hypothetical protein VNO77_18721 [Canavalia gladiata]|uniref:Uncharacterized protein n=1 Tax=Canavalia gladiata TaxID=3824 RepID=A0AAN9QKM3_CANGL
MKYHIQSTQQERVHLYHVLNNRGYVPNSKLLCKLHSSYGFNALNFIYVGNHNIRRVQSKTKTKKTLLVLDLGNVGPTPQELIPLDDVSSLSSDSLTRALDFEHSTSTSSPLNKPPKEGFDAKSTLVLSYSPLSNIDLDTLVEEDPIATINQILLTVS